MPRALSFSDLAADTLAEVFEEFGLAEESRSPFILEVVNPYVRVVVHHDPLERAVGTDIRPRPSPGEDPWTAPRYDLHDVAMALGVPHEAPQWGPFTGDSVVMALGQIATFLGARCRPLLEGDFSLGEAIEAAQAERVPKWMSRPVEDRLVVAAERALRPMLAPYGFRMTRATSGWASTVELENDCMLISVVADWREGELTIEIAGPGPDPVPIADFVDLSQAKALSLRRLSRGISASSLRRRLRQVGALLVDQAHDKLSCAEQDEVSPPRPG